MKKIKILLLMLLVFLLACGTPENIRYNSAAISNGKVGVVLRWAGWRFNAPNAGRGFISDLENVIQTNYEDMGRFSLKVISDNFTAANISGIGAVPEDSIFFVHSYVDRESLLTEFQKKDFSHILVINLNVEYSYNFFAADKSYFQISAGLFPKGQSEKILWRYTTERIKIIAEDENEKTYSRTQMMLQGNPMFPKFYKAFVKYAIPLLISNLKGEAPRPYQTEFSGGKIIKMMNI